VDRGPAADLDVRRAPFRRSGAGLSNPSSRRLHERLGNLVAEEGLGRLPTTSYLIDFTFVDISDKEGRQKGRARCVMADSQA
jgi:hypothetical protein